MKAPYAYHVLVRITVGTFAVCLVIWALWPDRKRAKQGAAGCANTGSGPQALHGDHFSELHQGRWSDYAEKFLTKGNLAGTSASTYTGNGR
jgi:hypothetical protein